MYLYTVAPTIKEGPQALSVHVNMPVILECIVSGVPAPRVTWRKHGSILTGNNPRFVASSRSIPYHSSFILAGLMTSFLTRTGIFLLRTALFISSPLSCLTQAITCAWPLTRQAPSAREWICKFMVSALCVDCKKIQITETNIQ